MVHGDTHVGRGWTGGREVRRAILLGALSMLWSRTMPVQMFVLELLSERYIISVVIKRPKTRK